MRFSIVIPTYNEEKDIADTIECLLALSYQSKEIIIVDDSTDNTPKIVGNYADKGVKLITPTQRRGRCEARNIGINNAIGEILVILNADVHPPADFLEKIDKHYDAGADFVCVLDKVENENDLFARYVDCVHGVEMSNPEYVRKMVWTEGFSVRRDMALKTSLFPSGFAVPIVAGEDAKFGFELEEMGAKKIVDPSIIVYHIAPASFEEYWKIRKGRGEGTPQIRRFLDGWSYSKIALWATLKLFRRLSIFLLVIPMLIKNFQVAKYSQRNRVVETFLFSYAWAIEQTAMTIGEYQSLLKVMRAEAKLKK